MGFNWCFFGVKCTGPSVAKTVLDSIGFSIDSKFEGMPRVEARRFYLQLCNLDANTRKGYLAFLVTELDGWTFFENTEIVIEPDLLKVARAINSDACLATAISTTWVLGMQYARPDGRKRTIDFYTDGDIWKSGPDAFGVLKRKSASGKILGFDTIPKILIGSDSDFIPPETVGREEKSGEPLPNEPSGLVISDDEKLIKLMVELGIPVGGLFNRYYCAEPDIVMKGNSRSDIKKACLEDIRRDAKVVKALDNNGDGTQKGSVFISGPLAKAGKLRPEEPKRSIFSMFKK